MSAEDRGWGPGWPNCQRDKIVPLRVHAADFPAGVRREVHPIFVAFLREFHAKVEPLERPGDITDDWGFNCRAIKGTQTPSNHSWGLAVDINAPKHPWGAVGTFTSSQAHTIRNLCSKYGMRWGGDYLRKKDEMHVEYMGTPSDARRLIETLGLQNVPQEDNEMELIANIQKALIEAGHDLGDFEPFAPGFPKGADGDWGSKTSAAFAKALSSGAQGPRGPQGPKGDRGPRGPQGPAGEGLKSGQIVNISLEGKIA